MTSITFTYLDGGTERTSCWRLPELHELACGHGFGEIAAIIAGAVLGDELTRLQLDLLGWLMEELAVFPGGGVVYAEITG